MHAQFRGKAWKFGDNINTDIISPPQYIDLDIADAAKYSMQAVRPEFAGQARPGDVMVCGNNMGSGSSREVSPLTIRHLGIPVIVAKSFARIFYRNCINLGLYVIECADTDRIDDQDEIEVLVDEGRINNITKNEQYACSKIPAHILQMVEAGGLVPYLKHNQAASA